MRSLLQDLKHGARLLLNKPGFTLVAVLTLALGVGATTAVFSLINGMVLQPLDFDEAEELLAVFDSCPKEGWDFVSVSPGDFPDWSEAESFESMGLYHWAQVTLTGGDEPQRLTAIRATRELLPTLRVEPALGRDFTEEESQAERPSSVALITDQFHASEFDRSPDVLGEVLTLDGNPVEIIGVLPASFETAFGAPDVWLPELRDLSAHHRGSRYANIIGRLEDGVGIDQAQAELSTISLAINEQHPQGKTGWEAKVQPLLDSRVGTDVRTALASLMAAVVFVFLIACGNIASLLLTRASTRQKEVAMRSALGAPRSRLVRQFLTESMLLALLGSGLGVLFALWGVDALKAMLDGNAPRIQEVTVNGPVLLFTFGMTVLAALLFGLVPAWSGSRSSLSALMNDGMRASSTGRRSRRYRDLLVVGQVGLTLSLLICAGLMIRSFQKLQEVDPGFVAESVLSLRVERERVNWDEGGDPFAFHREVRGALSSLPGVTSVSATNNVPLGNPGGSIVFRPKGWEPEVPGEIQYVAIKTAMDGFFDTMETTFLEGRDFNETDQMLRDEDYKRVIIVNRMLAEKYWPGESAVGKIVHISEPREDEPDIEVIGVVENMRDQGLSRPARPIFYRPYSQNPSSSMSFVLRTEQDPMTLADSARTAIWAINPDRPITNVQTMASIVDAHSESTGVYSTLLATLAGLAMLLSSVGIYGVMAYTVTQRTREIGIRMALGARTANVLSLVVLRSACLTLAGLALGLGAAVFLAGAIESLLFGVTATDPPTYLVVAAILLTVSIVASFLPARRATRIEPMLAMRLE